MLAFFQRDIKMNFFKALILFSLVSCSNKIDNSSQVSENETKNKIIGIWKANRFEAEDYNYNQKNYEAMKNTLNDTWFEFRNDMTCSYNLYDYGDDSAYWELDSITNEIIVFDSTLTTKGRGIEKHEEIRLNLFRDTIIKLSGKEHSIIFIK